jgi:hypothetical protein
MGSVTFPVAKGGDGSTVQDSDLLNGGHVTKLVPMLAQIVAMLNASNLFVANAGETINYALFRDVKTYSSAGGSSLASNTITVPAGTYRFKISAPAAGAVGLNFLQVVFTGGSTTTLYGSGEFSGAGQQVRATLNGEITLSATTTIVVNHYTASAVATSGLGNASVASATNAIFTEVELWKKA